MDDSEIRSKISEDAIGYFERIKDVYYAPFIRGMGIEIDHVSMDEMSLYLDLRPEHLNSRGFIHGAVIYALTDHTLAFAANIDEESVGQAVNIVYYRPVKEGRLISKSRLINRSKSLKVYEITVWCNGKLISSATCTAFRLGKEQ